MTVVQPNSIAGINSISVQSGNALNLHKSDGTLIRTLVAESGISTYSSISVGSATTDNNANKSINIGLGASISQHADNTLSFGTNGDERARITSKGELVIGATTSKAKFEIKDNGYTTTSVIQRISTDDASPYALVIANDTCSGNATQGMQFFVNNGGDHYIRCRGHSTAGNNNLLILSQNDMMFSSGASETERLRITSAGDVGIGTIAASCAIDVIDTSASGYIAEFRQVHASNSGQIVIDSPTDSNLRPSYIDLSQAGTVKWSVGQVYQSTSSQAFHICSGSSSQANSKLVISTAGNTGIGTASPDALLHLGADSATAQLKMQRTNAASNTNDYGRIYWESYSGTLTGQLSVARESAENDGYMLFKTAASGTLGERLRISSVGALGIAGANYGSSGQVLTSQGSGSAIQWATPSGGIDIAHQWRITSDATGNQVPLTGWELVDTYSGGGYGTGMSESSGIFTFPSTGWWLIRFQLQASTDNHTQNIIAQLEITTDNSSYAHASRAATGVYDYNNSYPSHGAVFCEHLFDVTNTSTHKARFTYGAGQGGEYVRGSSTYTYTGVTFVRIGDT